MTIFLIEKIDAPKKERYDDAQSGLVPRTRAGFFFSATKKIKKSPDFIEDV